jgi:iron complex outermembrane receptor protein
MRRNLVAAASLAALAAVPCIAESTADGQAEKKDAVAEAQAAASEVATLETVVVTVQKRREKLQDVPVAVTAISATKLAASNITSAADIGAVTPNLVLTQVAGTLQPHIRGVGTNFSGPGVENPVATYIDGVYVANGTSSLLTLNNISRIEVLKGPQGTLFGRNATGGLIQVITKDPTPTPSGSVELGVASFDTSTLNVYVTSGFGSSTSADLAMRYERQGKGWGKNLFNGRDVNRTDHDVALRSKILIEPSDETTIRLAFDYSDRKAYDAQHWYPGYPMTFNSPFFGGPYNLGGPYDVNNNVDDTSRLKSGGLSAQVVHDFGGLSFQSTTAYRTTKYTFDLDLDLTPVSLIACCGPVKAEQLSQEFQLSSGGKGPLQWVAGLYLFGAKDGYHGVNILLNGPVSPVPGSSFNTRFDNSVKTRSTAVYGQASYDIAANTTVTLGGRYTNEERTIGGTESSIVGGQVTAMPLPIAGSGIPGTIDFQKFSYRGALNYKFSPDIMAYISYSTGFKSGGYNLNSSANAPYKAEEIKATEAGLKSELFDRRLRFNAAVFSYEYSNIQVANFTNGTTVIGNGAAAKIYGLDFDVDLAVTKGLSISGGLGYVHDRFTSYPDAPYFSGFGGCALPPGRFCNQSAEGKKLGQSPTWTYNLGGNFKTNFADGSINFNLLYSYSSRWYAAPDNFAFQPSVGLLSTSVHWTDRSDRYSVRLWGKNMTNEVYATGIGEANQGVFRHLGAPRTYGVEFGAKF